MENIKILILNFRKSTGNSFSFSVPYPKDEVSAADIKALADFMIKNDIMSFNDKHKGEVKLSSFEKAVMQETTKTPVDMAA